MRSQKTKSQATFLIFAFRCVGESSSLVYYDWLFKSRASQLLTSSISQRSSDLLQRHLTSIYLQSNKGGKRNFDNWNEKAGRMKRRMKKIGSSFWLSISAWSIHEKSHYVSSFILQHFTSTNKLIDLEFSKLLRELNSNKILFYTQT